MEFEHQPQSVKEHLDRQDIAKLKREAHELRVTNRRLLEQVRHYRRWLLGYCGRRALTLLEAGVPGVFPDAQEHLDRMA